jgi:hypothetical protein
MGRPPQHRKRAKRGRPPAAPVSPPLSEPAPAPPVPPSAPTELPWPAVAVALAALLWVARYWHSSGFGLYEDDFLRIIPAMEGDFGLQWKTIRNLFGLRGTQGRPFHDGFIHIFSYIGFRAGGIRGMYVVGFAVLLSNSLLFFGLLRRLRTAPFVSLAGTLAFALFPADVTQGYLTITFGGQTSLTFLLLALHAYLSRCRPLAYPLIAVSLFCYELPVTVFLAAPLLECSWDRRLARRWAVHAGIVAAMVAGSALLRTSLGAEVIARPDWKTAALWPLRQMAIGPAVSLAMFFYRPFDVLGHTRVAGLAWCLPVFLALLAALHGSPLPDAEWARHHLAGGDPEAFRSRRRKFLIATAALALAGLAALVLAYPLAFTTPAEQIYGRVTRGHMAASFGGALVFACLAAVARFFAHAGGRRWVAEGAVALLLTGMAGLGLAVQRDYVRAWGIQRTFWTDVLELCPDLEDGTVILVDQLRLEATREVWPWTWYMPEMLESLYRFPRPWRTPPSVYALKWKWREIVSQGGGLMAALDLKGWRFDPPAEPEYILLRVENARLRRLAGPVREGSFELPLKKPGPTSPAFEKKLLYRYLILPPGAPRTAYAY